MMHVPGVNLHITDRAADSFNYWHSQIRIIIECTFGLFIQRWRNLDISQNMLQQCSAVIFTGLGSSGLIYSLAKHSCKATKPQLLNVRALNSSATSKNHYLLEYYHFQGPVDLLELLNEAYHLDSELVY
jgi:hypothetical protein